MAAGAIPKPQMRRLLERNIGRALVGAVIFSAASGVAWYLGVSQPRKQRYADFYKTYDAEAKYKIMRDAGLLQSCGPGKK